jgi:hypothetical protein
MSELPSSPCILVGRTSGGYRDRRQMRCTLSIHLADLDNGSSIVIELYSTPRGTVKFWGDPGGIEGKKSVLFPSRRCLVGEECIMITCVGSISHSVRVIVAHNLRIVHDLCTSNIIVFRRNP